MRRLVGAVRLARVLALGVVLALAAGLAVAAGASGIPKITAADLAARIETGKAPFVLDVRTPEEYAGGHIPGAVNIPYDQLSQRLAELPSDRAEEIVVHCQSGRRASVAEGVLAEAGYTKIRDLEGHWQGWHAAGLPTE